MALQPSKMPEMTKVAAVGRYGIPISTSTAEPECTSSPTPPGDSSILKRTTTTPPPHPTALEEKPTTHGPRPPSNDAVQQAGVVAAINAAYDWTGPSDPDDPRNLPASARARLCAALTLLAMVGTHNLGLACGPLVGGPLSELCGRRAVVLCAAPAFMLFVLGGALAGGIAGLAACRFFAGVFAAPLINNAPATMLDLTPPRWRGTVLGVYYTVPSLGASLGPLVGGFLVQAGGWRWTQWASLALAGACYLLAVPCTRETYKKIILRRRAARLGLRDSASQRTSPGRAFRHFATTLVQRPLHMLCTEPIVALVSLYCGFLFALLYTFVVAVPWIFTRYYGFPEPLASLSFLGLIVGTLSASIPLVGLDVYYYQPRLLRWQAEHDDEDGTPLPSEHRLIGALAGSFLLPLCLFAAAWTAEARVHWIVPIIFQGCIMFTSILVYSSASLFMLDAYGPLYGASASGAAMMTRYVLSAAFPLFALQMYEALGVGWSTTLLGCVALVMAPIPWCFWMFGARIRKRSRYETSV
ncbi:Major facilitator superfamily domain, general substrate transporter [Cordyceps fumosorosea ARSEF 2679]|uniref:Major facilitator superfamily domain, general substrate transporter n=1 Tax=Cordyceps fumosorosea (strain ARSEF 2679) TaxID=1081104 RepID=A0A168ASC5_CORFA|nr:Major facilitator superfamily domain, general substrate transporter [Cordyceps fumosorosea ARSEF 2679]OAA69130.1 Major facilitator superfamily domain, general substrate transporter [Cordyceps fumosorosea ARSEF 2679]